MSETENRDEIVANDPRHFSPLSGDEGLVWEGWNLDIQVKQLANFIHSDEFKTLSLVDRDLINQQFTVMCQLLHILTLRIKRLPVKIVESELWDETHTNIFTKSGEENV